MFTSGPRPKHPVIFTPSWSPEKVKMSSASSTQRLTTNDALTYLKTVKENFQDKRDKYADFLEVMKDFKAQRIDAAGVVKRVKELFEGHRDLILGFNAFLPKGYEIILPPEELPLAKKPVVFEEAIGFVNKIKTRFQQDDHVYKAFLHILNMYRKKNKSITEVYREVSALFQNHADLLVEFTHFLPDTSAAASVHFSQPSRNQILSRDDRDSPMSMARSMHIEKKHKITDTDCDISLDQSDLEERKTDVKEKVKIEHIDRREQDGDHTFTHKRKLTRRDDSVPGHFNQGMLDPSLAFCEKVKERLKDSDDYTKFMDCVRSYDNTWVTRTELQLLVNNLLGTHPDLMEEFNEFITHREKYGCLRNNKRIFRSLKVEDRGREQENERENGDRNKDRNNIERERLDRGVSFSSKDVVGQRMSLYASKDKYIAKPIQELDLSNCESCTPSYKRLPDIYQIPSASQRTKIGNEVLNDDWVSVTSGSEDYSFKHMRKNEYEESLFRCEDDRFELDMLLESVKVTARRVEELLDKINDNTIKTESFIHVEDHLTVLNLRCIERLYGDHGLDVMDVLRKNALLSLPVILTRLKQKQEEWTRCRSDFNKVWAEIYSKNYHKSLDHRSFYFKQQDTKSLGTKALLAEIKEISEKNQKVDDVLLSKVAGTQGPNRPDMEFEFPDLAIHEDLYKLIKYSCGEVCTTEQAKKVMRIWTNFLEPMLGVPPRPWGVEETEYVVKATDHNAKSSAGIGESHQGLVDDAALTIGKPPNTSENVGQTIPSGKSSPSTLQVASGVNEVTDDNSHSADYVVCATDVLLNGTQYGMGQIVVSATSGADKRATCEGQLYSNAGAEEIHGINSEENTSGLCATPSRVDNVNAEQGMDMGPSKEPQECVTTQPISSSVGIMPAEFEAQKSPEGSEFHFNCETEVGDTSPILDLQTCEEAEEENDADEGDESADGSLDGENAAENCDVSETNSVDGGDCFFAPNENGERGKNDEKSESEGEVHGMTDAHDTNGDGVLIPFSKHCQSCQPLVVYNRPELHEEQNSQIFYGNNSFYVLFRLHQILYERVKKAKFHASSAESKRSVSNDMHPTNSYSRLMKALYSLLDGSWDNAKFEDECRAIIGIQSYLLFTLDKLIYKLVKQLQAIATDEIDSTLLQLYTYERSRNTKNFSDAIYHENACCCLYDESLYRIEFLPSRMRLAIQLMEYWHNPETVGVPLEPDFRAYMRDIFLAVGPDEKTKPQVYLKRNKRKYECGDEASALSQAMEGLVRFDGLEHKIDFSTYKMAYTLDTEDFMYRKRRKKNPRYQNGTGIQ